VNCRIAPWVRKSVHLIRPGKEQISGFGLPPPVAVTKKSYQKKLDQKWVGKHMKGPCKNLTSRFATDKTFTTAGRQVASVQLRDAVGVETVEKRISTLLC